MTSACQSSLPRIFQSPSFVYVAVKPFHLLSNINLLGIVCAIILFRSLNPADTYLMPNDVKALAYRMSYIQIKERRS